MNVARALPLNAFANAARSPALPALGLAVIVSLCMFWLMYEFMGNEGHSADNIEALPSIDFVRLRRDSQTETLERRKPPQ